MERKENDLAGLEADTSFVKVKRSNFFEPIILWVIVDADPIKGIQSGKHYKG